MKKLATCPAVALLLLSMTVHGTMATSDDQQQAIIVQPSTPEVEYLRDKSTRIKWVLAPHPNVAAIPTPRPEAIIAPTHPLTDFSDYLNEHTGYDPCKYGEQSGAADYETRSRRGVSLYVLRSLY